MIASRRDKEFASVLGLHEPPISPRRAFVSAFAGVERDLAEAVPPQGQGMYTAARPVMAT